MRRPMKNATGIAASPSKAIKKPIFRLNTRTIDQTMAINAIAGGAQKQIS